MVGVNLGLSLTAVLLLVPSAMPAGMLRRNRDAAEPPDDEEPSESLPTSSNTLDARDAVVEAMTVLGLTTRRGVKASRAEPKLLIHNGLSSRMPRRPRG